MFLEIITPDKKIYEGEVTSVKLPGSNGSFGVMNNHAPIISTLDKGTIKIIDENKNTLFFDVNGGVVEVMKNKIVVLAESI
ncbi:MAG: ATP synthase F1 subunit epsilon [Bacteroidota bacterium]|nr:ATP synthase F1 subunit epsilon [Bacteroidota bacterium]